MNKITKFLIFLIVVVVLIVVATAAFIGAGYLLSLILPLTLFQSCNSDSRKKKQNLPASTVFGNFLICIFL